MTDQTLKLVHNCLLFSGEENVSSHTIRSLNAREKARWILVHQGVGEYLTKSFLDDPKPLKASKEILWKETFSRVNNPPPRWHHYSMSELNNWFNVKRATIVKNAATKFVVLSENWQSSVPRIIENLFPEVAPSPKFYSWIIEALRKPIERRLRINIPRQAEPVADDLDLEKKIDSESDDEEEINQADEGFKSILKFASE